MENIDILIIAVMYNNSCKNCLEFIDSIFDKNYDDNIKLLIVDNSSNYLDDILKIKIIQNQPRIEYLKSSSNLGYFGGAKFGFEKYLMYHDLPKWVIISNVDIIINQNDFFKKLSVLEVKEDIGIIAPSIISKRWGTDTNPKILKRYSKVKIKFYLFICLNKYIQNFYIFVSYLKKIFMQEMGRNANNKRPQYIYAPHGSFIIFSKNYFKKGGDLNHISFLFGEEIFIAESALKHNLRVLYTPDLQVVDYEHVSTGKFYSTEMTKLMKQSTKDIIRHYYML